MNLKPLFFSGLACALAACSVPLVDPDAPAFQHKIGHVNGWDALTQRTAEHFASSLRGDSPAVYVAPGPADMPFASVYRKELEQNFLERGFAVSDTAAGAMVLRFDVQPFRYDREGRRVPAVIEPIANFFDQIASVYDTTKAEVLVTLTVSDNKRLLYRDSETFYVPVSELHFYRSQFPDYSPQQASADVSPVSLRVHDK